MAARSSIFSFRRFKDIGFFVPSLHLLLLLVTPFVACQPGQDENVPYVYNRLVEHAKNKADLGRFDERGKHLFDSAYAAAGEVNIADKFQYYIFNCAYNYHSLRNYDKAMLYADSMLSLIVDNGKQDVMEKEYAQALFSKGDILSQKKLYDGAFDHYYKARNIARKTIDPCTLSDYSYRLGMLMYKKGQYKQAATFFKQSFVENQQCGESDFWNFYRRQELLNNTALSFLRTSHADSAIFYSRETIRYLDTHRARFPEHRDQLFDVARAVAYNCMGSALMLKGEYSEAEELLLKSIKINSAQGGDVQNSQTARLALAKLYFDTSDYTSFKTVLSDLKVSLVSTNDLSLEAEWHNLMWKYYQVKHQPDDAFIHLLQYISLKDSLAVQNKALLNSDLADKINHLERESELATLRKDAHLTHVYLAITILVVIMALVIVYQTVRNWKVSKKNVKVLEAFNNRIKDQKRQLELALSELEKRNKEKDRILRSVAHDLRNPIGAITTLSLLMLRDKKHTGEDREMLGLIQSTCSNSLDLISEILEASGTGNTADFKKEVADVNVVVRNSVDLLNFKALEKDQHITYDAAGEAALVYVNREKISRVINNLLSNAIKFSPQGAAIHVTLEQNANKVLIGVTDQGIGIPENLRSKVFNMFTQAKRSGTAGEKSFGLGLSISRTIVEAHGGRIWFESIPDEGTSFYVELDNISHDVPAESDVRETHS